MFTIDPCWVRGTYIVPETIGRYHRKLIYGNDGRPIGHFSANGGPSAFLWLKDFSGFLEIPNDPEVALYWTETAYA